MRVVFLILIGFNLLFANIVVDKKTNLMWQDNSDVKSVQMEWSSAIKYCKSLTLGNYDDWYLPTAGELLSIADKNSYNPAIKNEFDNIVSSFYWSSSTSVLDSKEAWFVHFEDGRSFRNSKIQKSYVRCVRVGQ